ncbi:MAG: 50S ribosomal protein L31e [Candidatus Thermoplasmatota archaeon]|nr:50S ribosomal protein L31e [Candidatus Thermoplasmatota archaeon]
MVDEEERVLTVPLRKAWDLPRTKRVPGAIKIIRTFVQRHMKAAAEDVWIDPRVNEELWARGIQKPPRRIRIKATKFEDNLVEVSLPEA